MNFWELIGLPSKKNINKLRDDVNEIKKQIEMLTQVITKDEKVLDLSNRLDEKVLGLSNELDEKVSDLSNKLNEKALSLSNGLDEIGNGIGVLKENNNATSIQIQSIEGSIGDEIKTCQRIVENLAQVVAKDEKILDLSNKVDEKVSDLSDKLNEKASDLSNKLDEKALSLSNGLDEIGNGIGVLKENNNATSIQIQNIEGSIGNEIKALEDSHISLNKQLMRKNAEDFNTIKNEMEDIGVLLKILAMQGISEEME